MKKSIVIILTLVFVGPFGCGYKGDLYLPDPPKDPSVTKIKKAKQ